jgi:transcriptional regulator with XRE-family HTH domain
VTLTRQASNRWAKENRMGRAVRVLRERRGVSRADLSRRTGVPVGELRGIESGNTDAGTAKLFTLYRALDVDGYELRGVLGETPDHAA